MKTANGSSPAGRQSPSLRVSRLGRGYLRRRRLLILARGILSTWAVLG